MCSAAIARWSAAVGLWKDNAVARPAASLSRAELLTRYRRFREVGKQHHSAMLKFLAKDAVISQARRLGLAQGKTLVLDSIDDLNLVFDLLIYTAPKDRSRAIDRYARSAQSAPNTDEVLVLEAMRQARFAIITRTGRHPVAGLLIKDVFRGDDYWLVDEALESSLPDEAMLATRLYNLDGFTMTAGVVVPLDTELIEDAIVETPQLLRKMPKEAIDDRRFAEAIYRAAVVSGIMEQVGYQDTIAEAS
ncbi:MAG: hypothetical protein WCG92_21190 [Hyphomicrobiales bacterium]